jgi:biotin carboxyl carrier protein
MAGRSAGNAGSAGNGRSAGKGRLRVGDAAHDIEIRQGPLGWDVVVDGETFHVAASGGKASRVVVDVVAGTAKTGESSMPFRVEEWQAVGAAANGSTNVRSKVRSPMSGKLVEVRVQQGAAVGKGDVLFVLEAMKMQNEVRSPASGIVASVQAKAGETLDTERVVLEIEPA